MKEWVMENKLNIKEYLDKDEQKDLLRLLTAGSVDDGKSTLIGRLLFDSKKLYEDQLAALERDSKRVGNAGDHIDYALLCDGLKAEREQGITIDVAYRYFSTNNRKFIIAGYNEDRIYDFVPFVGFGFAHSYDAPRRNSLAFNFGIINTFHLASAWDLNLELYGMGTENKFDGKTTSKGPDFMAGATVGITYKFPQRGFKPAPDVDAIMALTSSQMDAINTALAQQIEQNRQLKAQLANQPTEVVTEQVTVNQIAPAPQSVFFQIGSAVLPTNSTVNLQQIADLVKDNPGLKLKVTGYADSDTGSAAWNKQLSEDRANNVANELVKLGVNKNNLIISGMGGVNTLTPPAFNRRVIIEAQ
jgi:outer membrane protein OmpA-like peptidoglycan-associated protein